MPELVFTTSYEKYLDSRTALDIPVSTEKLRLMRSGADQIGISIIPPLNADLRFLEFSPKFKLPSGFRASILPESWNWARIDPNDSDLTKAKKRLITPVPNQGMCGSCWAVSMADAISDRFVVSGKVDANPSISPTYIMSCYQNRRACNGGNPSQAAQEIAQGGCVAGNCIDYDIFCSTKNGCRKGDATKHFNTSEEQKQALADTLPKCGCVNPNVNHDVFFINNPQVLGDANFENVKQEIYQNGPVVAGFWVFNNFRVGGANAFKGTNGVYLENYEYDANTGDAKFVSPDDPSSPIVGSNMVGGHAVVIVGWGNTTVNGKKVNYWIVRNSWGENWCEGGYFNMAWYGTDPESSNQVSQFDKVVNVNIGGVMTPTIGTISFDVGNIDTTKRLGPAGAPVPPLNESDPKYSYFNTQFQVKPLVVKPGPVSPKPSPPTPSPTPSDGGKTGPSEPGPKPQPSPVGPKGETTEKPFYKKPWFIISAVVILILGIIAVVLVLTTGKKKKVKEMINIESPTTVIKDDVTITTYPKLQQNFSHAFLEIID